ncbi:hypothetical protein AC579_10208 [Pseudocercospora musae]|uniref:Uncharacterized protein n=1 Tax=Pseudocercospora musae TaxID=113226 RepID=A0A139GV60_9PEZI|nr:hypothetical protein AC579_10208 [Pseudocercospora musae]
MSHSKILRRIQLQQDHNLAFSPKASMQLRKHAMPNSNTTVQAAKQHRAEEASAVTDAMSWRQRSGWHRYPIFVGQLCKPSDSSRDTSARQAAAGSW